MKDGRTIMRKMGVTHVIVDEYTLIVDVENSNLDHLLSVESAEMILLHTTETAKLTTEKKIGPTDKRLEFSEDSLGGGK